MSEMRTRIHAALHASDGFRRLRDYGVAALFFRLPAPWRARLFRGDRHYCPLCGTHLRRFLVLHRDYHFWCPVCRSLQRHRLVWLLMQDRFLENDAIRGRMLHIAPEVAFSVKFEAMTGLVYITADLSEGHLSARLDICDLPFGDSVFDFLMCSHVLGHVSDDRRALQELRRVSKADGTGLLLVPIMAETTFEDQSITDPAERERLFGQLDHVRAYGRDFKDRVRAAGFDVTEVSTADLATPEEVQRMGLPPAEKIFVVKVAP